MDRSVFLKVLEKIENRLRDSGVNWAVTGSLGFWLQGMPTEVHDIDIQTDKRGAYRIERLLKEYVIRKVEFSQADRIRSYFGALMIDGIKVEIMGDIQKLVGEKWEEPVDIEKYKNFVYVHDMKIPVLSLDYEYQAYKKMGRIEKAEMIKKWLSETRRRHHDGEFDNICYKLGEEKSI
ncbi:nucleotidyltransferase domain-containing protein [Thermoanaerobacterium sp. DL9XJH110]|uniref:nucleotidyltransferase domain-containing protein n=1 Tax=Thermoanaerobacterium sp. DL9XJH110 TaxID=3386643 RepID=UPI003BB59271